MIVSSFMTFSFILKWPDWMAWLLSICSSAFHIYRISVCSAALCLPAKIPRQFVNRDSQDWIFKTDMRRCVRFYPDFLRRINLRMFSSSENISHHFWKLKVTHRKYQYLCLVTLITVDNEGGLKFGVLPSTLSSCQSRRNHSSLSRWFRPSAM